MWWNGGRRADHRKSRDGVGAWDERMRGNVLADLLMRDMVGWWVCCGGYRMSTLGMDGREYQTLGSDGVKVR
jgi:hypothetical protein